MVHPSPKSQLEERDITFSEAKSCCEGNHTCHSTSINEEGREKKNINNLYDSNGI